MLRALVTENIKVYRDLANEWGTPSRAEKSENQGPKALFS